MGTVGLPIAGKVTDAEFIDHQFAQRWRLPILVAPRKGGRSRRQVSPRPIFVPNHLRGIGIANPHMGIVIDGDIVTIERFTGMWNRGPPDAAAIGDHAVGAAIPLIEVTN